MPAGTIYMYHARGGDSLNISARGQGNAVLIKYGFSCIEVNPPITTPLTQMKALNPMKNNMEERKTERL